ncbi:MAG: hydantoinase B/oxoprolinase family protein, partial [Nitrososphaerales archaeon]
VIIMNDPYLASGTHLPDWSFYRPVFVDGELLFFVMIRGHQIDTGGAYPHGYHPGPYDIHSEGIRIRPVKIFERGEIKSDVYNLILDNVRWNQSVKMDHLSFVAALKFAEREIQDLVHRYGKDDVLSCGKTLVDITRETIRKNIDMLPDGQYYGESSCDDDGTVFDKPVTVRALVRINGPDIIVDLSESDPEVRGFVNIPLSDTRNRVYLAILTTMPSEISSFFNQGVIEAIEVVTKPGTCVHPSYPAPVGSCPLSLGTQVVEAVWMALAEAAPENIPAVSARALHPQMVGYDSMKRKTYSAPNFWGEGGGGAIFGHDGWPSMRITQPGVARKGSVELYENSFPLRALRWEIATDHCGAGKWRGGVGNRWEVLNVAGQGLLVSGPTDGGKTMCPKPSRMGATPPKYNEEQIIHDGTSNNNIMKRIVPFLPNDVAVMASGGGGGVGNPKERDLEKVKQDVMERIVSVESARIDYGVVIDPTSFGIDIETTRKLRAS